MQASEVESGWLREAALRQADPAFAKDRGGTDRLRAELLALQRNAPTVMVMQEMATPRETHVLLRGSYDAPGEKVDAGVPGGPARRMARGRAPEPFGSRAVADETRPPADVAGGGEPVLAAVLRAGLVKTSDNFGMQGEWPSHPELLDWLAREFVDSGWNVKALHENASCCQPTYRQDSAASPELDRARSGKSPAGARAALSSARRDHPRPGARRSPGF